MLDELDYKIIQFMADEDMKVGRVAKKLSCHRNTIDYRRAKMAKETGCDPGTFWGLAKLLGLQKNEGSTK